MMYKNAYGFAGNKDTKIYRQNFNQNCKVSILKIAR